MGMLFMDNVTYSSKKPLDDRTRYDTIANMVATKRVYDGIIAYVTGEKKYYTYDSTNTEDVTLGKWREFESGGGGDTTSMELTAAEYASLTPEEQMNGTIYFIKDGEGGGGGYNIKKVTLAAGTTTVEVPCPTSGDYITDIYTSDGRDYLNATIASNTLTITFEAPSSTVYVYVQFREV